MQKNGPSARETKKIIKIVQFCIQFVNQPHINFGKSNRVHMFGNEHVIILRR